MPAEYLRHPQGSRHIAGSRSQCHSVILEESDFAGMNEEWVKWFPANPPARQGAKMPVRIPGMKVSIALIAEA